MKNFLRLFREKEGPIPSIDHRITTLLLDTISSIQDKIKPELRHYLYSLTLDKTSQRTWRQLRVLKARHREEVNRG